MKKHYFLKFAILLIAMMICKMAWTQNLEPDSILSIPLSDQITNEKYDKFWELKQEERKFEFALSIIGLYSEFIKDSTLVFVGYEITWIDNADVCFEDSVFQWWYNKDNPKLENFVEWIDKKYKLY